MYKHKLYLIFIGLLFVISCTRTAHNKPDIEEYAAANPGSFIEVSRLGCVSESNNTTTVTVTQVSPDTPAAKADIHTGDIVLTLDNVVIKSDHQLRKLLINKRPDELVTLTIKRNDTTLEKQIKLGKRYFPFDAYILLSKILDEKPVRLAIIMGEVTNATSNQGADQFAQWKKGIESEIFSYTENGFIRAFNKEVNFAIVDRAAISSLQSEFDFQQSGLISEEFRSKLGKMLGATHILVLSFSRFRSSAYGWQDTYYRKLIDVETGKVLASIAIKEI